jgi:redox-sensitive bicupin YhaK (pirin superfamily)
MAVFIDGDSIVLQADTSQDAHMPNLEVFLIGGQPIREQVIQYGPFVMNTKEEIIQAMEDYQKGRFGHIPVNAIMPHTGR